MPFFTLKSVCPDCSLAHPEEDYRAARRVGQYRVGAEAIYFPAFPGTRYLPFAAVTQATVRETTLCTTGCCGKGVPVVKVHFAYETGAQDFLMDPPGGAEILADCFRRACPETPFLDRRSA